METFNDRRAARRLAVDIRQLLMSSDDSNSSEAIGASGLMKSIGIGFQLAALGCALRPDLTPTASFIGSFLGEFRSDSRLMPLVSGEVTSLLQRSDLSDVIAIANSWAQPLALGQSPGTSMDACAERIVTMLLERLEIALLTPVENPLEQVGLRVARIVDAGLSHFGGDLAGGLDRDHTRTVLAALIEGAVNSATFYLYCHSSLELVQVGNAASVVPYLFHRSEAERFVSTVLPTWRATSPLLGPAATIELYGNLWTVEHQNSFERAVQRLVDYADELQNRPHWLPVLH